MKTSTRFLFYENGISTNLRYILCFFLIYICNICGIYKAVSQDLSRNMVGFKQDENQAYSSPFVSADGRHMLMVIENNGIKNFYEMLLNSNGSWDAPIAIDVINSFGFKGRVIESPSYNGDCSEIYYSANYKADSSGTDIYYSKKVNGRWTLPIACPPPINSLGFESQPCISFDGKRLYFTQDTKSAEDKGFFCPRICVSERTENGWTNPSALPYPVNAACERCPRIAADGKTLFFSSNRDNPKAKGGFDMYYTKEISKSVWIEPVLVEISSSENDDLYPSVMGDGKTLLYSNTWTKNGKTHSVIKEVKLNDQFSPEAVELLTGIVIDKETQKPLKTTVSVENPYTSRILYQVQNDETGRYTVVLHNNKNYRVSFNSPNYSQAYSSYFIDKLNQNTAVVENIALYRQVKLKLNILDAEWFSPLSAQLNVYDISGKKINIPISNLDSGMYELKFKIGEEYKVSIVKNHYKSDTLYFDMKKDVFFDEYEKDIELKPLKKQTKIKITDDQNNGLEVPVELINLTNGQITKIFVKPNENGEYIIELREGDKYEVNVNPQGYSFFNTTLDLATDSLSPEINAKLTALKQETQIRLNNINFESNSAELKVSSFEELDRMLALLEKNPQINIEISAHTDDIGSDVYNMRLSEKRAITVVNYLVFKGISDTKLLSKGYGESKPLIANTNEQNRAQNRRVEFKIISIDK